MGVGTPSIARELHITHWAVDNILKKHPIQLPPNPPAVTPPPAAPPAAVGTAGQLADGTGRGIELTNKPTRGRRAGNGEEGEPPQEIARAIASNWQIYHIIRTFLKIKI